MSKIYEITQYPNKKFLWQDVWRGTGNLLPMHVNVKSVECNMSPADVYYSSDKIPHSENRSCLPSLSLIPQMYFAFSGRYSDVHLGARSLGKPRIVGLVGPGSI